MISMYSTAGGVNYAHYSGVQSVAAPIIFTVLYILLMAFCVYQSIRQPWRDLPALVSIFCAFRVISFTMRAILAGTESAGHNIDLVGLTVYLYDIGFLSLLYNAYMVVCAREPPSNASFFQRAIGRIRVIRDPTIIHTVFIIAFIWSVLAVRAYAVDIEQMDDPNLPRITSIYLLFVVTVVLAMQALVLVLQELSSTSSDEGTITPLDPPYPIYVLCFIALLLLTRQTFFTATSTNPKVQNNEKLFYPLSAVTEFLAACLLAVHWREPVHFRR